MSAKMEFSSKTNVMVQNFALFSLVLSQKRPFFAKFFGKNIYKNHNIGPRLSFSSVWIGTTPVLSNYLHTANQRSRPYRSQ
jgi:hypothetical protein